MLLLVIGHSYVGDLASLGEFSFNNGSIPINIRYSSIPGASYDHFLKNRSILSEKLACRPDIVVVILGGNSILRDLTKQELFNQCREFYSILRDELPSATIISAQIENRFYKPGIW